MANLTLSIPDWLHRLMKKYSKINWSEVARRAIVRELLFLKAEEEGLEMSELLLLMDTIGAERAAVRPDEEELQRIIREREEKRSEKLKEAEV